MYQPQSHLYVVIMMFLYTIQHTHGAECPKGWFGEDCSRQCHCHTQDDCKADGKCTSGKCEKHFFGPRCQIYDAFSRWVRSGSVNAKLHDGDDSTCVSDTSVLRPSFTEEFMFNWMRLVYHPTVEAGKATSYITLTVDDKKCEFPFIWKLGNIADVYCGPNSLMKCKRMHVVLKNPQILCSVHLSLGRNLALKNKHLASSYPFLDRYDKKYYVDGNLDTVGASMTRRTTFISVEFQQHGVRVFVVRVINKDPLSYMKTTVISTNNEVVMQTFSVTYTDKAKAMNIHLLATPEWGPFKPVTKLKAEANQPYKDTWFNMKIMVREFEVYADSTVGGECLSREHCKPELNCVEGVCVCTDSSSTYSTTKDICEKPTLTTPCQTSQTCNPTQECLENVCSCPESLLMNRVRDTCEKPVNLGDKCESLADCIVSDMICVDKVCKCDPAKNYEDSKSKSCMPKKNVGSESTCTSTEECGQNSTCLAGICKCHAETEFFDTESSMCSPSLSLSDPCTIVDSCKPTMQCKDGTCQCDNEHFLDRDAQICKEKLGYDEYCNNTEECLSGIVCFHTQCRCSLEHVYNRNTKKCEDKNEDSGIETWLIIVLLILLLLLLLLLGCLYLFCCVRKKRRSTNASEAEGDNETGDDDEEEEQEGGEDDENEAEGRKFSGDEEIISIHSTQVW